MSKSRVTSRYAQKQKKELTKQSLWLFGLSILIGLLFLIVILPNAIKLFFNILDKKTEITQQVDIPPQPPIVSSPQEYTNQSEITLTGYATSNTKLRLEVNNQTQDSVEVSDAGEFEIAVKLSAGENTVKLFTINSNNVESEPRRLSILLDTQAPEIELLSPADGAVFRLKEEQVLKVEGLTKPRSQVFLNDSLTYSDSNGNFSFRHQLSNGENKLRLKVIDRSGNETEKELTVFYRY